MRGKPILSFILMFILLASLSHASIWDIFTGMAAKVTCADTDKGDSQYEAGKVTYNGKSYEDACSGTKLTENYCLSNKLKQKTYACKYGCADARCVNCIDSDSGIDFYKKGTTYLYSTSSKKYKDTCINALSRAVSKGAYILEYYCKDNKVVSTSTKCNCADGVCIIPKLEITVVTPKLDSTEEAFSGELEVVAKTNINAKCEIGLFRQILSKKMTPMQLTGGTEHTFLLTSLDPSFNYMLIIGCASEDGQSLQKTINFKISLPEIKGYIGVLTDDELYNVGGFIKLI